MKCALRVVSLAVLVYSAGCDEQISEQNRMKTDHAAQVYGLSSVLLERPITLDANPVDMEVTFSVPQSRKDYEIRLFFPQISGFEQMEHQQAPTAFLAKMVGFTFEISHQGATLAEYEIRDTSFRNNHAFNFGQHLSFWVQSSVALQKGKTYRVRLHFPGLSSEADPRLRDLVLTIGVPRRVQL